MGLVDFLYSITTGSARRRAFLTPVGLIGFFSLLFLVIFVSFLTDSAFGLPLLFPGALGMVLGIPLLVAGLILSLWCIAWFLRARGTPVPFNPPRQLVVTGPYALTRNPMLTGVFACLLGLGFITHSTSMVLIWTPVLIIASLFEVKLIEEPELERRFGAPYREYCRRVPMFIPRVRNIIKRKMPSQ